MASRKQTGAKRTPQASRPSTTLRFDDRDRAAIKTIVGAGWAKNLTGAVQFALKYTADAVSSKRAA